MNGTVFTVIFIVGLAGSLFSLSLIGLAVFLSVRDMWIAHRICRQMGRVRAAADREWAEDERQATLDMWDDTMDQLGLSSPLADETRAAREDAKFDRTLKEIQSLPIANPWSVL